MSSLGFADLHREQSSFLNKYQVLFTEVYHTSDFTLEKYMNPCYQNLLDWNYDKNTLDYANICYNYINLSLRHGWDKLTIWYIFLVKFSCLVVLVILIIGVANRLEPAVPVQGSVGPNPEPHVPLAVWSNPIVNLFFNFLNFL